MVFNLDTFSHVFCNKIKPFLLHFWVFWWFVYANIILQSFGAKTQGAHVTCPSFFSSKFLHLPSCQHGILLQKERSRSLRPYCDVAKSCDRKRTCIRAFAHKFQKWAILGPISLQPLIKKLPKVINCLQSIIFYKFMPKEHFFKMPRVRL